MESERCIAVGEEFQHQLLAGTVTLPGLVGSVGGTGFLVPFVHNTVHFGLVNYIVAIFVHFVVGQVDTMLVGILKHVFLPGTGDEEQRGAPRRGAFAILQEGPNDLVGGVGLTVVAHEQHAVGTPFAHTRGVQLIAGVDYFLGIFGGLVPLGIAGVHASVQIQTGQQHPAGGLVHAPIVGVARLLGLGIAQVRLDVEQLVLDELVHLGARTLLWCAAADRRGKGDVAPAIHQLEVVEGAQETDFRGHRGVMVGILVQVLVAEGDSGVQTVVVAAKHRVRGVVGVVYEVGDTLIAPAADGLVGGQVLGVPHLTVVTGGSAVDTVHITVAVGTTVAGGCHRGVALGEQQLGGGLRIVGVDRLHIKVTGACCRSEGQRKGQQGNKCFDISFHDF